jgi:transposase
MMKPIYRCCAGIDVHKKSVSVCIRRRVRGKRDAEIEEAVFGTFTADLEGLSQWLRRHRVKEVAMESTGVYWMPVWNVLESAGRFHLTLVNPATVRALQGHKTDRVDARRIAEYLQYGLLRASFIPPKPIRQLRELTRMRAHVQHDRNRVINRIGSLLETVNIKLGAVATQIVGKSARAMLRRLAEGAARPEQLAELAMTSLRSRKAELVLALDGRPDEHFRWMLKGLLRKLDDLDAEVAAIDARLSEQMLPHEEQIRRLDTIPGVDRTTARVLIAELGTDMSQFPDAAHAASWAGLCPGNKESAGKRFSGRTNKGNRYLRRILVQSAWGAFRKRNCFLASLFFRISRRHGRKKAAVAVAHRILIVAWSMLRNGVDYQERGGSSQDQSKPERTARKLVSRLERIGFEVTVTRASQPKVARQKETTVPQKKTTVPPGTCGKCWKWGLADCIHVRPKGLQKRQDQSPSSIVDSMI